MTTMSDDRILNIRRAEAFSHTEAYTNLALFKSGSWLSKPVKSVMDLIPYFDSYSAFHGLDLGCGVGRNCIPVLRLLRKIPCRMDCVDILSLAIDKLRENAEKYDVLQAIQPIVSPVDTYPIKETEYDLILGISVLEHLDSPDTMVRKLVEIKDGLRPGGIACFVVNTAIKEHEKTTGHPMPVQFEINLQTDRMERILDEVFSGFETLKHSVIHYQYDTYRESGIVVLDTDVLTFAVRKRN